MSESDTPNDTWSSLILEFRARLNFHVEDGDPPVSSEEAFRETFEQLCNQYRERENQRLSARIRRQHVRMIDFTTAIDESYRFQEADALSPLIWQLIVKAIQASQSQRCRICGWHRLRECFL